MLGRHSTMGRVRLALAQLVVVGAIIYALYPTASADVEAGENMCFPLHWCLPGTTGKWTSSQSGNPTLTDEDVRSVLAYLRAEFGRVGSPPRNHRQHENEHAHR